MRLKIKKIFTCLLMCPLYLTSCNNNNDYFSHIKKIVFDNFNTPSIRLADCSSVEEAQNKLCESLSSNEKKLNEILFDYFNFLCINKFTLDVSSHSHQITPEEESIYSLFNSNSCNISAQYEIDFLNSKVTNNFFVIKHFQAWITVVFTKNVITDDFNLVQGNFIQFVYDAANIGVEISIIEKDHQFWSNFNYVFIENPAIENYTECFGIIKGEIGTQELPLISIDHINWNSNNPHGIFYSSKI